MSPRQVSRRFPDYGWAWPKGSHDRLLKAVLLDDREAPLAAANRWLDTNDIDDAPFRDHRLLAAMVHRFGRAIAGHSAYPRLAGLQRQLWAQSQLARREAEPVLARFAAQGIPFMLLKGASRIALDPAAEKGRVARDIDVLVHPRDMARAFAVAIDAGWQASTGASAHYLRTQLAATRAVNLFAGRFGDIDLHQLAYPAPAAGDPEEEDLWSHAVTVSFGGVAALVPGLEDRAALAIAHGVLDAHSHSDWVIDCATAVRSDGFRWNRFVDIALRHDLAVGAAVTLSYLTQEIGVAVPDDVLGRLLEAADAAGADKWGSLIQAKPRSDLGPTLNALRWLAKERRKHRFLLPAAADAPPVHRARRLPFSTAESESTAFDTRHALDLPRSSFNGLVRLDLVLRIALPPFARRVEFEINGPASHVARFRYRKLDRGTGTRLLRFTAEIRLAPEDEPLAVESRPVRQVREWEGAETAARFGPIRFQLVSVKQAYVPP